jgi:hypothetical protein
MPVPDVAELIELAECLSCLAPGQLSYIEASLISSWEENGGIEIASSETPDSIGAPLRWYDAGTFVLADGATIATTNPWIDQSSNLSNATPTAGNEPIFKTNIFGSRPAVRLSGTKRFMFDSGVIILSNFTILAVAKVNGDSIWISRNGINRQVRAFRSSVNNLSINTSGGTEITSGTLSVAATDGRMIGYRRDSGTGVADFFENRVNFAGGNNIFTIDLDQIGIIDGGPLNIDIGEMVIYDSVVSEANIQLLYDDYFKPKFGLP